MSVQSNEAPPQPLPPAQPARHHRTRLLVIGAVVALLLLTAAVVVIDWLTRDGDTAGVRNRDRIVSGPRDGRDRANVVLLDGTKSVTVRTSDLGDQLYRVETPAGGDHVPQVAVVGDEVKVGFGDSERHGASSADIQLSSAVRWNIRVLAGATEQVINLADGKIDGVDLAGGATRIDLTLPRPDGTTTVRMSGGVGQWVVHQTGDAPVQVRVGSGAATVTIDGTRHSGISGGTVFTPPAWGTTPNRVDLDAVAGMSTLVVDRVTGR